MQKQRRRLRLLRVPEAQSYIQETHGVRLSEKTLRQWILLRKVAVTKVGGLVFIQRNSLDLMVREIPATIREGDSV